MPEETESFAALKKGGRSARNEIDEGQKDEVPPREVYDEFQGKSQ